MGTTEVLLVFGGAYDDAGDAIADFEDIKDMHANGEIGDYDGVILTKEPNDALIVTKGASTGRFKSAWAGAIAGAVLGVVFPPSVLVLGGLGAGAGALAGRAKEHISKDDFASLGDLLQTGESGILVVTTTITDWGSSQVLKRAKRTNAIQTTGDSEAIVAAVRHAGGLAE